MARHEADREDLLGEATALRHRGELQIAGWAEPVVAGRRDDGRWSVYFGGDPCYHFDGEGRLRRAFVDGRLYRTEGTTLSALTRTRTAKETELRRRDLSSDEVAGFLEAAQTRMAELQTAILERQSVLIGQHPENGEFDRLLVEWLTSILSVPIALAPPIR